MDALGNHENIDMDFDMIAGSNEIANMSSSYLGPTTLETATPSNISSDPTATYIMQDQVSGGQSTLVSDETMGGVFLDQYPIPITGENSLRPAPEQYNSRTATPLEATDEGLMARSETATTPEKDWRALVDFDIPDYTQARITDIPQFQALYDAYHASYTDSATMNATRMKHAKALAFCFLKHYYPASQGYLVEPSSLGPVAEHGMNFILAVDNSSDSWQDLPDKKPVMKKRKVGGLTKKQKEAAGTAAKIAEYEHGMRYTLNLQWDWIEPEDIAGFVVMRKADITENDTGLVKHEYRPYTYLAIMIDTFDELPRFSTANTTHRSDVLADALCSNSKIRDGYGILVYGPRIEFYGYEAGTAWIHYESDDDTTSKKLKDNPSDGEEQDIEPVMKLLSNEGNTDDMAVDMRTTSLAVVDQGFRMLTSMSVTYADDVVDSGIEQSSATAADDNGE